MVHLIPYQLPYQLPITSKMFEKYLWKSDILSKDAGRIRKWNIVRKWVQSKRLKLYGYKIICKNLHEQFNIKNIRTFTSRKYEIIYLSVRGLSRGKFQGKCVLIL